MRRESTLGNPGTGNINHAPRSIFFCIIIVLAAATEATLLKLDIDHDARMVEIKSDARKSNHAVAFDNFVCNRAVLSSGVAEGRLRRILVFTGAQR